MDKKVIIKLLAGVFLLSPMVSNAWEKVTAYLENEKDYFENEEDYFENKKGYFENEKDYVEVRNEDQIGLVDILEKGWSRPAIHIGTDFARVNFLVPFVDANGEQGWPSLLDGKQALVSNVPQFFFSKKRKNIIKGDSDENPTVVLDQGNPGLVYVAMGKTLKYDGIVYRMRVHERSAEVNGQKGKVIYVLENVRSLSEHGKKALYDFTFVYLDSNGYYYSCVPDDIDHQTWKSRGSAWGPSTETDLIIYDSVPQDLYFFPTPALLQKGLFSKIQKEDHHKDVSYTLSVGTPSINTRNKIDPEKVRWQAPNVNNAERSGESRYPIFEEDDHLKIVHPEFYGDNDGSSRKALILNALKWPEREGVEDIRDLFQEGCGSVSATPEQYWEHGWFGKDTNYGLYGVDVQPSILVTKMSVKGVTYVTYHVFLDGFSAINLRRRLFSKEILNESEGQQKTLEKLLHKKVLRHQELSWAEQDRLSSEVERDLLVKILKDEYEKDIYSGKILHLKWIIDFIQSMRELR